MSFWGFCLINSYKMLNKCEFKVKSIAFHRLTANFID